MISVRAEDLIAALQSVPAGAKLVRNDVGNLSILIGDRDAYAGYVDLMEPEVVIFPEDEWLYPEDVVWS